MKDIFVDQLMNVSIFQGVARMDFARIDSIDSEANQAKVSPSYRVCMSLTAFSNLADQVAGAKAQMQRQAGANQGAAAGVEEPASQNESESDSESQAPSNQRKRNSRRK